MMGAEAYRVATCEELWVRGRCVERRLSHGAATETGDVISASDERDDRLVAAAEAELARLRTLRSDRLADVARVRLIAEASREGLTSTLVLREQGFSVVTSPEQAAIHRELLRSVGAIEPSRRLSDYRGTPIVWRNGSGSVLLHEAAGHPAEHRQPPLAWPLWLEVRDGEADLLSGQPPVELRRASFRDIPMRRMRHLVVRQKGAPFELSDKWIEVLLVDGGAYEPLDESVTVRIAAADLVTPDEVQRLEPFEIVETRAAVARALAGAAGPPVAYPGVICSSEGQELVVRSSAPDLVTVFR